VHPAILLGCKNGHDDHQEDGQMQVKTILNRIHKLKSFVYGEVRFGEGRDGKPCLEVEVLPRKGSRPECSGCGRKGPVYDRLDQRPFGFPPLWGIAVLLLYRMRRVDCATCGVKVERVPWGAGKSRISLAFALHLADWAKSLTWEETARRFGVGWHQVFEAVRYVVEWGLDHRDISGVTAIGIDEVHFGKGQKYLTVVYQLCGGVRRLLFVGRGHDSAALDAILDEAGGEWCAGITHVCTDMWKAYLKVIGKRLLNAVHILDRFHIAKLLNEAVDLVRRREAKELRKQGVDLLVGMKYVFLKRPENLTEQQEAALKKLMDKRWLASVRAWHWKEKFQLFWGYTSPYWARRYLRKWCKGAMRSRLDPLKKFAGTMRAHEDLILNWFAAKKLFSSGPVEGMNRKINLVTRKAYGYRSYEVLKIALFHTLGHLPEPEMTHRF
jgi:transposase